MKKKIIACGLVASLAISMLAGCGTRQEKVTLSVDEVLTNAVSSLETVDSIQFDAGAKINAQADIEGTDMEIKGSASAEGVATLDDPSTHLLGEVNYEYVNGQSKMSGAHKAEMYGEYDKDSEFFSTYAKIDDGDWNLTTEAVSDPSEEVSELVEELTDTIKEMKDEENFSKLFKINDKVQKVNGKKCYLIYADVDKEVFKDIMKEQSETDAAEMEYFDKLNISYKVYFDKETYYPVKVVLSAEVKAEFEEEGYLIEVKEFEFELNTKVNEGKKVNVPEEVKEAAKDMETDGVTSIFDAIGIY